MKTKDEIAGQELRFEITQENYERAITANSGGCLVADAIKEQYPQFSNVKVDVATVRFTDKGRGMRYVYLTTPSVRDALLYFDQGWKEEELPKMLRLRTMLKIIPITRSASMVKTTAERRAARLAELETKEQGGEQLTSHEKSVLTRLQNPKETPVRPTTYGPMETEVVKGDEVIVRGRPEKKTAYRLHQANMLAGRDRHFGAKTAKPSAVFQEAVKAAVQADRAERGKKK